MYVPTSTLHQLKSSRRKIALLMRSGSTKKRVKDQKMKNEGRSREKKAPLAQRVTPMSAQARPRESSSTAFPGSRSGPQRP